MFRAANLLLSIVTLLTFPFSSSAQQAATQPIRSLVNVLDRNGNAIRDLKKENFRVKVNGHPATVMGASYSLAPRRIVVLLDMSGSMTPSIDNKKWKIASEALEDLLTQTPQDVPVALLTFSDQVRDVLDFTQSRSSMATWMKQGASRRGSTKGRTALRDAILVGLNLLQPYRSGDAVYAITDGGDNMSHASSGRTRAALRESGVRLFAFLFAEPTPSEEEREGVDSLVESAVDSGGFVFGVRGYRGVAGAGFPWEFEYDDNESTHNQIRLYTQMLNIQVNGFYVVQVAVPQLRKASKLKVEIIDSAGRTRKDVGFTYQRWLPGDQ
jgi:Mg-chelatase subunit ChlD